MAVAVGDDVTATWGNSVRTKYVKKSANQSVTSSTTPVNDTDLFFVASASTLYRVELILFVTGAAAGDIRLGYSASGTVTSPTGRWCMGPDTTVALVTSGATVRASGTHGLTNTAITYGTDGTNASSIREEFVIDGGASGGTLTLQWAQGTSSGTATNVLANSYLVVTQVEAP